MLLSGDRCGEWLSRVHSVGRTARCFFVGWASYLQRLGHIVHQLVPRTAVSMASSIRRPAQSPPGLVISGASSGSNNASVAVAAQWHVARRRRIYLPVFGLVDRDRRRVLPQEVGRYQNHQFRAVLGDHRRGTVSPPPSRRPPQQRTWAAVSPLLRRSSATRRAAATIQTRRRTYPRSRRQTPDHHRLKRRRGRKQVTRHAVPHLRGGHQRGRSGPAYISRS